MAKLGAPSLDKKVVSEIQRLWAEGKTYENIAAELGVSVWSVSKYTKGLKRESKPDSLEGEIWKTIDGYGGRYSISNYGRLFSNGTNGGRVGIIKTADNGKGYQYANLSWNGKTNSVRIHRLVAEAFCEGKTEERNHVNHIDGNPSNNRADNLEWVTRSENMLHSVHVLGHKTAVGNLAPNRKLTAEQVIAIRADTRTNKEIAADYGIGHSTVSNVKLGYYYKEVI